MPCFPWLPVCQAWSREESTQFTSVWGGRSSLQRVPGTSSRNQMKLPHLDRALSCPSFKGKAGSKSGGQPLCVRKLFNLTPCFVVCTGLRCSGRAQHCPGHHLTLSICLWQLALGWQRSCLSAAPREPRDKHIS